MSADSKWVDFIQNTIGANHLLQVDELSGAFNDSIGSLSVPFTAGITTNQTSLLKGNSTDKSILGAGTSDAKSTQDIQLSTPLTTSSGGLRGPWCFGFLMSKSGNPTSHTYLWGAGDQSHARSEIVLYMNTTDTFLLIPGVIQASVGSHATTGLTDGNPHLILINYNIGNSPTIDRFHYSIDGAAFTSLGADFALVDAPQSYPSTGRRFFSVLAQESLSGVNTGVTADEFFLVPNELSDAQAADIYDKALVTGFPSGIPVHLLIQGGK